MGRRSYADHVDDFDDSIGVSWQARARALLSLAVEVSGQGHDLVSRLDRDLGRTDRAVRGKLGLDLRRDPGVRRRTGHRE
jgi:hypothetical protein